MNRSTQIWAGVVVFAALAGGVYYKAKEDQKIGTSQTTSADLPELKAPEDPDKIAIVNADKGEVVLEKQGDKWWVTKPVKAIANQANVKTLMDNLKELKSKEVIFAQPTEENKKDYQFEASKGLKLQIWKGSDKKLDVTFGKSGARGQMAMMDGKPAIFAVSGYSSYLYGREVKGWRDTEIVKFDDQVVSQLTLDSKKGKLSFTKGDKWVGSFKDKPIEKFDEEKVKDALRTLKTLNAEDFGDGKPAADTGLAEPEAVVTVLLKDNAAKYTIKVGKISSGSARYAQKEGDETIYVIPSYAADWAMADVAKFQKNPDAGAPSKDKKGGPTGMPPGMQLPPGMQMPHGMPGQEEN